MRLFWQWKNYRIRETDGPGGENTARWLLSQVFRGISSPLRLGLPTPWPLAGLWIVVYYRPIAGPQDPSDLLEPPLAEGIFGLMVPVTVPGSGIHGNSDNLREE